MSPVWGRKRGAEKIESEAPAEVSVWLDVHAAATYADVPLSHLSQAIRDKRLAVSTHPVREVWMVNLTDLEAWHLEATGSRRGGGSR